MLSSIRFAFTGLVLLAASCSRKDAGLLSYRLQTGAGSVVDLAAPNAFSVILLIEPADVFACGNHISRWMEWERRHPGQFVLLFSRAPRADEQRQLVIFRIRPDGILADGTSGPERPHEYLVSGGKVVLSQEVAPGSPDSPLLKAVEQGQVAGLLNQQEREAR